MQHNLDYFKQRLNEMKARHTSRISKIDRDIRHEGMSADWAEQAVERENDEVLESLGNASTEELGKINAALKRIDSGEFFECSQCGDDIPIQRLEALPFTTVCVRCAQKNEQST